MIDPCKGEKCILYPRCMHKVIIKCDKVDAWIEEITVGYRVNKSLTLSIYLYFTYNNNSEHLKKIWRLMKHAIPGLKCIDYRGYRFYENDDDREVIENEHPMR
jgi:uncharacterized protein (DUF608 family)